MTTQPSRAEWWREVTDPDEVIQEGRWYRIENNVHASEYLSKVDAPRSHWSEDRRVFIDSRWTPPAPPLKVGDKVTSVEQLEVLPIGSVVLDKHRNVWQGQYNRAYAPNPLWHSVGVQFGEGSAILLTRYSPLTVIWLPETEDDQ